MTTNDIYKASILIVDDQGTNIDLLQEILWDAGYLCIDSTTDPLTVSALHQRSKYDLILLDLQMPGMDGFEVMKSLRAGETLGYVPILVITGRPDHKLRALACGAKDFIAKPFEIAELTMRIQNMLEVRLLYKQLDQQNRELKSLALHDELTGLPNRRLLIDRLSLAVAHARRVRCVMAVMFLDLDGFKQINDTLGHDVGDALLLLVSERLVNTVREVDTVARLGGDEFMIVLPELCSAKNASELASTVIQAVSEPYVIQDHNIPLTVSVGVSIYPLNGENIETLMKNADVALYEAKRAGKNDFRVSTYQNL